MFIGFFLAKSRSASIVIKPIEKALKKGEKGYKVQLIEIKTRDSRDIYILEKLLKKLLKKRKKYIFLPLYWRKIHKI